MRPFLYFVLTIFFCICTGLVFVYIDPKYADGTINPLSIITLAILIAMDIAFLYLMITALFLKTQNIYHSIRALILGILASSIFTLKVTGLISLVILCIIVLIYVLSEITIFEFSRR